jgi:hypothetical protein
MATKKPKASSKAADDVDAFMAALEHPRKADIEALRRLLLAADPGIAEGITWNAPSFRTTDYFATVHLRARDGVQLILHLGAKARTLPEGGLRIDDPAGQLQWLGKDRATVHFRDLADIESRRAAFTGLVRQWLRWV